MVNSLKILVILVSIICIFSGCVSINNTNHSSSNATGKGDEINPPLPTKELTTQTLENITKGEKTTFEIIEEQNISELSINDSNAFKVKLFKELFKQHV
jgi:hypothetical protein